MKTWITTTKQFEKWRDGLDKTTRSRLHLRLEQFRATGHFGDHHGVGGSVSEMRLMFGPGYRVYYTVWEYKGQVLLLLLGGDKSSQRRDIKTAKSIVDAARVAAEQEIDERLKEEQKHGKTDAR